MFHKVWTDPNDTVGYIKSSWQPWHYFTQKSVVIWWVNTKRLPGA